MPSPKAFHETSGRHSSAHTNWSAGTILLPCGRTPSVLSKGIFRLLNKEIALGSPTNWNPAGTTRLWRYNLHYFDYALDLAVLARWEKDERAAELLRRFFREWIEANPVGEGVGWHSYPIARRIVNWVQSVSLVSPEAIFQDDRVRGSMVGEPLSADALPGGPSRIRPPRQSSSYGRQSVWSLLESSLEASPALDGTRLDRSFFGVD